MIQQVIHQFIPLWDLATAFLAALGGLFAYWQVCEREFIKEEYYGE